MKNLENKNYQYKQLPEISNDYERPIRLSKRGKRVLGMLGITAALISGVNSRSKAHEAENFNNHPKLEQIDTYNLAQNKIDLESMEKVSSNGGFIELDEGESVRSTLGHYNGISDAASYSKNSHTAIASVKNGESLQLHLDGDIYRKGDQVIVRRDKITDATTGEKLRVENDRDGWVALDNYDNDFEANKK